MKITFNVADLKNTLSLLNKAIDAKPPISILGSIILYIDEENSFFFSMGQELSIKVNIDKKTEKGMCIAIPSVLFTKFINSLDVDEITMHVVDNAVKLTAKKTKITIATLNGSDYPLPTNNLHKYTYVEKFSYEKMHELLNNTSSCIDITKSQQVLRGVFLYRKNNKLHAVGTDTARLCQSFIDNNGDDFNLCIIHKNSIDKISSIINEKKTHVDVQISSRIANFIIDNIEISSQVIAGDYPNVSVLLNREHTEYIEVDRKEMIEILKQVSVMSSGDYNRVFLSINGSTLSITTEESEIGSVASEIVVNTNMSEFSMTINSVFLSKALSTYNDTKVMLYYSKSPLGLFIKYSSNMIYLLAAMV